MILLAFLAQTLRIAIPYLFAATGGVISERSGAHRACLEGYMLGGAFCGALASYYSGSPWVGLLGAAGGGAALALLVLRSPSFAFEPIRWWLDRGQPARHRWHHCSFLRLAFHQFANSPRVPGFWRRASGTGPRRRLA